MAGSRRRHDRRTGEQEQTLISVIATRHRVEIDPPSTVANEECAKLIRSRSPVLL
jgi:hypothetical protein